MVRVVVVLALLAGTARAQEMTDEDWLELAGEGEQIVVWDERPEKPFDRDTERRLTGEELARRGATDLASAIALLPDVTVRDVGRGGFNIDIRGARKGAVRVLVDGVAVSDPFYGTFDVASIPITDIEEIRVSTAPASPIDGPGGPGGVIEVHTRDAVGPRLVIGRVHGDSLPTLGATATGRVQHDEHVAFRLSASSTFGLSHHDAAAGRIDDERRATTGAARFEHRDGARRFVLDGFADDRRYVSPPSDELATALILLIDRETTGRVGVGYDDSLGAGDRLQVQARTWIHAMQRVSRNFRDAALTDQANAEALSSMRAGAMGLATRPIGTRARWVTSLTIDHERADATTTIAGQDDQRTTGDATIVEAAGGGQVEIGPVELDAAVGLAIPAGVDAAPWPEAKLSVEYAHRWGAVELIAARKGRVPSLRERFHGTEGNAALDPEHASHGELRVTARPRDDVEVIVAPYARRTTGTVKVGAGNLLMNVGTLDVHGVDVTAKAQLVDQLAIGGGYAYATAFAEDLEPPEDAEPIDRFPHHRVDAWLEVRPLDELTARVRFRAVGAAVDRAMDVAPYQLWDVTITGALRGGWLGAVRCDDLLDVAPETRIGFRQPGRVISLSVQREWN